MNRLQGKGFVGGKARGQALVTAMPVNFTASFSKPANILPGRRAQVQDRHHELFKQNIKGKVLVFPAVIGSTYTGMMLLQLMFEGAAPAAMVVKSADPLLVSGPVLASVWFQKGVPLVEYGEDDIFERIKTGDQVEVDGDSGEIVIKESA